MGTVVAKGSGCSLLPLPSAVRVMSIAALTTATGYDPLWGRVFVLPLICLRQLGVSVVCHTLPVLLADHGCHRRLCGGGVCLLRPQATEGSASAGVTAGR